MPCTVTDMCDQLGPFRRHAETEGRQRHPASLPPSEIVTETGKPTPEKVGYCSSD